MPSPPTSWQPASAELQIGTSNLLPAASKKSFPSDQEIIIQAKKRQRSISKNLVETSGGDFLYSDRNDSFKVLADCVEMRHGYQKQGKAERNLHPIPFLADGPGYGKSRFLQELPSSFIKFVQEGAYSQNFKDVFKTPVCTNISFSNGTAYSINEASQISIEQSVCLRILYQFETEYSNFGCFYFSNKSQQFNLSNILQIIGTDASCIILGIDEVNNVYEIGVEKQKKYEIGVEKQKKLNDPKERLLSGLFELIGRLSCGFSPLFIPVLAGTAIGPIKSAARESTHPPLHIPLPLLSFESCLNIFAKKNTKFSQLVQTSHQLRQLISDCGGHGRSLEILYNSSLKAYAEDASLINWKIVIDEVRLVLHQRYEISTVPLTTAIARSFLSLDTDELDRYGEMKDTTYQDLEERGLIKLQNGKVKISHFFVCCFLYKSKYKTDLTMFWRELLVEKDFWWQGWEVFNIPFVFLSLHILGKLPSP